MSRRAEAGHTQERVSGIQKWIEVQRPTAETRGAKMWVCLGPEGALWMAPECTASGSSVGSVQVSSPWKAFCTWPDWSGSPPVPLWYPGCSFTKALNTIYLEVDLSYFFGHACFLYWFFFSHTYTCSFYIYIRPLRETPPISRPSQPSRLNTGLSSLCHTANSHLLSILLWSYIYFHAAVSVCPSSPLPTVFTSLFSMSTSPMIPCK